MQRLKDNKTYRKTTKKTHLLSSVSLIFNKLDTFARTWADPTTFDGKLSCANPTLSNISLILAATTILTKQQLYETRNPSLKKKKKKSYSKYYKFPTILLPIHVINLRQNYNLHPISLANYHFSPLVLNLVILNLLLLKRRLFSL